MKLTPALIVYAKSSSDPNIFQRCSLSDPVTKWPIPQVKMRTRKTSQLSLQGTSRVFSFHTFPKHIFLSGNGIY